MPPANKGGLSLSINDELKRLIELVGNVTDAHTAALFLAQNGQDVLEMSAVHTLSSNLAPTVSIKFGKVWLVWWPRMARP